MTELGLDRESNRKVPGSRLLGGWPLCAALVIAFNVFYWRKQHPGFLSGKLSDLGINFFLPVLLLSSAEWLLAFWCWSRGRAFLSLGQKGALFACSVSAGYFALLKLVPSFTPLHVALLGAFSHPFGSFGAFRNTADPSDLLTLVTTPLAYFYLTRPEARFSRP